MIVSGKKISGRYEIIKQIGQGGMADVYLAFDEILERKVAVKILRGDMANDERFVRRFQREALSASSLDHPNIVEMYDVGEDDGKYYIVMEFLDGPTLKQLIQKRGSLSVVEVVDIMKQLTNALAHAHSKYIIHRDVKPQNIIMLEDGTVKITDFGIALATNQTQLTHTNTVMGSVHYLAPEQASGAQSTTKSDIYSLGVMMFELLTGELPFKGDSPVTVALKQLRDPMPKIKSFKADIPQSIENIITKSTAKEPDNRYDSIEDMHNDLETALNPERANEKAVTIHYYDESFEQTKTIPVLDLESKKKIKEALIEEKDVKPKKSRVIPILVSVLLSLIFFIVNLAFIIPAITESKEFAVPDVIGMDEQTAIQTLEEAGLVISGQITYSYKDDFPTGVVFRTTPSVGNKVKKGSVISLYVSKGTQKITIEDYTNLNALEIKGKLEALGLKVNIEKIIMIDTPDMIDPDKIIKQDPAVGTQLLPGKLVTLYVPRVDTTYPDMVSEGWSIDMVKDFATRYGLILDIREEYSIFIPQGLVISQSRDPKDPIIPGASLIVHVSKGPEPAEPEDPNDGNTDNSGNENNNGNGGN